MWCSAAPVPPSLDGLVAQVAAYGRCMCKLLFWNLLEASWMSSYAPSEDLFIMSSASLRTSVASSPMEEVGAGTDALCFLAGILARATLSCARCARQLLACVRARTHTLPRQLLLVRRSTTLLGSTSGSRGGVAGGKSLGNPSTLVGATCCAHRYNCLPFSVRQRSMAGFAEGLSEHQNT